MGRERAAQCSWWGTGVSERLQPGKTAGVARMTAHSTSTLGAANQVACSRREMSTPVATTTRQPMALYQRKATFILVK